MSTTIEKKKWIKLRHVMHISRLWNSFQMQIVNWRNEFQSNKWQTTTTTKINHHIFHLSYWISNGLKCHLNWKKKKKKTISPNSIFIFRSIEFYELHNIQWQNQNFQLNFLFDKFSAKCDGFHQFPLHRNLY